MTSLKGAHGIAVTPLRPSGTVKLDDGQRLDAITDGSYIAAGTTIVVVGYSSGDVVVIPK
jgi:membrane-bound serine protease (ClpP class)